MSITREITTSVLNHLKIKAPQIIIGNPYWVSLDLTYLSITIDTFSDLPLYDFLLIRAEDYSELLFKFYKDYSYEIRSY
jgi:hypothetical protein